MKVNYAELKNRPRTLQSLTGLKVKEFEALLVSFEVAWEQFLEDNFKRGIRKRAFGGGRKAGLQKVEDKLLFILIYFRLYSTQEVQGFLFEMSQSQTNEWVHNFYLISNKVY